MMKKLCQIILLYLFILAGPGLVYAEGILLAGSGLTLEPEDEPVLSPDIGLFFGADLFGALSEEWSLFFSGGAYGYFTPLDQKMRYQYTGSLDLSCRSGIFFFKSGLYAKGEQFYAMAPAVPDRFENRFELEFSFDIGDVTLFFLPMLSYKKEDLVNDNLHLLGETGVTFLLSERFIMTAEFEANMTIARLNYSEYALGPELKLSYYPDEPFTLAATLGGKLNASDYEEPVAGVPVKRLDYFQMYAGIEVAAALAAGLLLEVQVPVKFTIKAMNAVREGAFTQETEWTLVIGPQIGLSLDLGGGHGLRFVLKGEPLFSNSDYYNLGYFELRASYQLTF